MLYSLRSRLLGVWHIALIFFSLQLAAYGFTGYMANRDHTLVWEKFNQSAYNLEDVDIRVPYGEKINYYARKEGINPKIIASVIQAESSFQNRALSSAGAYGVMQIMPATWRQVNNEIKVCSARHKGECSSECYYNVDFNIQIGIHYLGQLLKKYHGNMVLALAAYNAGPGAVDRYGGIPPYEETIHYTEHIIQYWYEGKGLTMYYPTASLNKQWDKAHEIIGWCLGVVVVVMMWTAWRLFKYQSSWLWR